MKVLAVLIVAIATALTACGGSPSPTAGLPPQVNQDAATTVARAVATMSAPAPTPEPPPLASTRKSEATVMASGNVSISAAVVVADYQDYVARLSAEEKRRLSIFSTDVEGAKTIGLLYVRVENKTNGKISVYPDQGTVVVGTEQVKVQLFSSDRVGGEFFPGVIKEGAIPFFLKRTTAAEVKTVTYAVDGPFGESFSRLGPDYQFKFTMP